jgi:MFS family permease
VRYKEGAVASLRLPRLSSLRALAHPDFSRVWLGALVSNIGTWMETIALGVYVTQVTGRAEWTGGIAALTYLPSVVLSPLGGALADRFDRRAFLAVGAGVQALLAGLLTVLAFTGRLSVPAVAVISFLNGCAHILTVPAFAALITEIVPREALHSAFSLNSAQYNLGRIIGPALAAGVLATGDPAWALLLNTVSFLAVLVALARVRGGRQVEAARPEALWPGIVRGMRVAREDAAIWLALGGTLAVSVCIAPFIGLVPVFALKVLRQDAAATSLLVTAQGVGAVTAALLGGSLVDRLGRGRLLEGSVLLLGPVAMAYWLAPSLPSAALAMFGLGAVYLLTLTGLHTLCQARAPLELQARVSSLYSMVLGAGYAVGVWMQGALADRVGVRFVTACAAGLFLALVLTLRSLRPRALASLEG